MNEEIWNELIELSDEEIREWLGIESGELSHDDLLLVAQFVEEIGSLEDARALLDSLGQLRKAA